MKHSKVLFTCGVFLAVHLCAATIAEHSGANNPTTEGFAVPPGYNDGNGSPVYNDLGLGINAWNVNGSWCCSGYAYSLSPTQETDLTNNDWLVTVYMRDLYTGTSGNGFGPNSLGGVVSIGVDGLRYSIDIHSDGKGDQVLAPDPFAKSPTYTIQGLGQNYALFQMAYDATSHTVNYYVNGQEVISNFAGYRNYYENWLGFGGQDSNFNLVQLQPDTTITTATPEPSTILLVTLALAITLMLVVTRNARFRR